MSGSRLPSSRRRRRRRIRPVPVIILILLIIALVTAIVLLFTSRFGGGAEESSQGGTDSSISQSGNAESSDPSSADGSGENSDPSSADGSGENSDPSSEGGSGESSDSSDAQSSSSDSGSEPEPAGYPVIEVEGDTQQYTAVYRVGDTGFEMYAYVPSVAEDYASAVTTAADKLAGAADVYDLTVPTSSGITLPDKLWGQSIFSDQGEAAAEIEKMMGANVKTVPLFDTLMRHRKEYLYFRSDHHWTALGAYYAYAEFCGAKGIKATPITAYVSAEYPGFLGSFYRDCGGNETMKQNPDTVVTYQPRSKNATLDFTTSGGEVVRWPIVNDVSDYSSEYKYGAFIGGDNPYTLIDNPDFKGVDSCVVVKESFGNAFVPFLVDHYRTIHVIDYRYWTGNLEDFVRANGVDDVIFINNLSAIRGKFLVGKLQGIV